MQQTDVIGLAEYLGDVLHSKAKIPIMKVAQSTRNVAEKAAIFMTKSVQTNAESIQNTCSRNKTDYLVFRKLISFLNKIHN